MTEQTIKNTNDAEKVAELRERQIVTFKNIDKERFTHSFRGVSVSIDAGVEQPMRLPEADHLAIHLARKMLSRERKAKLNTDDRKAVLFTEEDVNSLKQQIITQIAEEVRPDKKTPEQKMEEDHENLRQKYTPEKQPTDTTKKEIIDELEKRRVKVDVSKSKEELLAQLMEAEASGD